MTLPVGLQLYTLREDMAKDFTGVLEKVAEIGYQGVEFAGFGDLSAADLKATLDRLGLKVAGSHTGLDLLKNDLDAVIDYNLEIGNRYIICPYADYEGQEDFISMAKTLNEVGAKCQEKGLQLCYHNHAHEFKTFDGEYGLDLLYAKTETDLVKAEIDTYWVKFAGVDPVAYLEKYAGRIPLVHLKDMEAETRDFAEVGNGVMNMKKIADVSISGGAEWLIVEQDKCKRPPLESVKMSYNNLKEMGLAE